MIGKKKKWSLGNLQFLPTDFLAKVHINRIHRNSRQPNENLTQRNRNGTVWLAKINLNYPCDRRVCYLLCVDFCSGYCSFLIHYSVGLEKAGLRVNRELSQTAKEKDIVSNTKMQS